MTASSDKLAQTRLAIIEHLQRKERRKEATREEMREVKHEAKAQARAAVTGGGEDPPPQGEGWFAHAGHLLRSWWRYHPARMATDLATPVLSAYARRKPVQFLGIAAAAGALFFLARPWKLISVTGVVVALLKSPQVASLIMSAMSSSQNPRDDEPMHD
ncbi:MAG TPA: hypothetical protein VD932_00295 [Aquabacterium sp.]|nr:hypothetical protein [Aquabacterium sp.]